MIFLTLGTQLPFERLVRAVDDWAGARERGAEVFAQIPDPGEGGYVPRHMEWTARLAPEDFTRRCESAQVIVSHAGMGSIITALSLAKPLILMARRSALGEHRNDHQSATAKRFGDRPGLFVAEDTVALEALLDRAESLTGETGAGLLPFAEDRLIGAVRGAILG